MNAETELKYSCNKCNYYTNKSNNYKKHLQTAKHLLLNNHPLIDRFQCGNCLRTYASRNGLWVHKKNCVLSETGLLTLLQENKELREMMIKHESLMVAHTNEIKAITCNTVVHNHVTNKSFNLNFFLNETCKNAMNMTDFVESINLQLSDLMRIGEFGYVEGLSTIINESLKALDVTQRPVHCTDKKRETIYIKDANKWEKEDENKSTLRRIIRRIASKNYRLLPQYREKYQGCQFAHSPYSDQYNKLVVETMGGMGDNEAQKENKIIRNIAIANAI